MNQFEKPNHEERKMAKEPMDIRDEYSSIRMEILTWTTVKFTIITITTSVTAITLSLVRQSSHWPWFSSIMIIIVACLGFLTAYANSKVTIAGAYITVFHSHRTIWDHLIYSELKSKWTVATIDFFYPMLFFYLSLYTLIVFYPAFIYQRPLDSKTIEIMIVPTIIYSLMILVLWRSGKREPYVKIWESLK